MNRDKLWTDIDSYFFCKQNAQFFIFIRNRIWEQTVLMGFVYPTSYRMPGCPMFHRSAWIDRPAKPQRVENSENGSVIRSASRCLWQRHSTRHGRNRHSSGIFTFFSFEEGSNFVQNIRHNRTSSFSRRVSFSFPFPSVGFAPASIPLIHQARQIWVAIRSCYVKLASGRFASRRACSSV